MADFQINNPINALFVYGTLAPGKPNEHVLKPYQGNWQPAHVMGELYESGWGAAMGFPGIVLNERGLEIHGQLFVSDDLIKNWQALDDFEGEGYQRVKVNVRLATGRTQTAYIYELTAQARPAE